MADNKQPCSFFLLRYVPDAVKNEFVNVGLVLLPQSGHAELRFTHDWARVRCLDPDADIDLLEEVEAELRNQLHAGAADRESMLQKIQDSFSNALQASELKACLADSPATEADTLARLYLERVRRSPLRELSTRQTILQQMRQEFDRVGAWRAMRKNIAISHYTREGDPLRIDCGYAAPAAVKMFHAVSLQSDVNTAKVLAFSYPRLAEGIRKSEGLRTELTAVLEDGLERNEETIAFALETLRQNQIRLAVMSDLGQIAKTAAQEMGIA